MIKIYPNLKIEFCFREYGYKVTDDTLGFLYKNIHDNVPEYFTELFKKGDKDKSTRATVSVIIKYTLEFAAYIGVHPKYGMYLLSAHAMKVRNIVSEI